jgi:transcription initiation factor TFIID subunit 9B
MGVHAYTERVPLQLLDFSYRYTSGILSDAIAYEPPVPVSTSKKSKNDDGEGITLNAVRTAILSRASYTMAGVLPKEFMAEIASERNRIALPRVEKEFGVRLPPERYCFTGVGWGVREAWEDEADEGEDMDVGATVGGEGAGGVGVGGPVTLDMDIDTEMGGVDEEDEDGEEEFEEVMGLKGDTAMVDG